MPKNCINCGAVLHGNQCEYCGTEYTGETITAKFNENSHTITFQMGNETFRGYISRMEAATVIPGKNCYRDSDGKLHGIMMTKRKLTVIEI